MESELKKSQERRAKRAIRVRKNLRGTKLKPRLSVHKSNQHIHVQLIDDEAGQTLAAVSTLSKGFKGTDAGKKSKASAKKLGAQIAELAKQKEIKEIVFDRGCYTYHGVLAELADAARENGLVF